MIETNLNASTDSELAVASHELLVAATKFFNARDRVAGSAGVVWLTDSDGGMVILTRGEYKDTPMCNIYGLSRDMRYEQQPMRDDAGDEVEA